MQSSLGPRTAGRSGFCRGMSDGQQKGTRYAGVEQVIYRFRGNSASRSRVDSTESGGRSLAAPKIVAPVMVTTYPGSEQFLFIWWNSAVFPGLGLWCRGRFLLSFRMWKAQRYAIFPALVAGTFFCMTFPVGAEEGAKPAEPELVVVSEMDPVVVTASRQQQRKLEAPYQVENLPETTLRERAIRSVPEAFEQTPGVVVQKTAHGQGSPYIRGVTAYHNLFLIDGIRLNNAAFRAGPNQYWNMVDSQGLRGIELVKSQGSVLFGSDAVGGTVQALTRRPTYAEEGFHIGGRSYTRYASAEASVIQRGEVTVSEAGKYGMLIGGTFKDFGDIDAAELGTLPYTGYGEWDVDGKLEVFLNPETRLTLFHQQVRINDAWRVHSTKFSQSFAGTTVGTDNARILDQERLLSYVQLDGEASGPLFDHYTLSLSHQRQGEERFRERSNLRKDVQGFDLDSLGIWAQFDKALDFTELVYGASYYLDMVESFRTDYNADGSLNAVRIQGPVGDDGSYHLASGFINSSTPLFDERLFIDLGARYTYAAAHIGQVEDPNTGAQISIEDDWSSLVGSGRLSYRLDEADQYRLFAGISQAFRAPNFSDLSRLDTNRSNEIETPSPNLDPEKFLTFEVGFKADTGPWEGSVSYFYTIVEDMILRTPTGQVIGGLNEVIKQNVGDGFIQGVELSGTYQVSDTVNFFGGFAYQDSQVSTFPTSAPVLSDEAIDRAMPINGYFGIRWNLDDGRFWVEGLAQVVDDANRLSTRDKADTQRIPPGGTPGYVLGTIRAGYRLWENVHLTAAVENISDEAYRAHGSGQNEPGRNFVLSSEIIF